MKQLSIKNLCLLIGAGALLSMLAITVAFYALTGNMTILLGGGILTVCTLVWLFPLVLLFSKRLSVFTDDLCQMLDNMINRLTMFISAKTHSTVLAITIPFIFTCVPPFLGKIAMLSRIMVLFPDQLLCLNKSLEDFSLYQIGEKIFEAMSIIIPLYLILFCIIIPILYLVYRRTQIK